MGCFNKLKLFLEDYKNEFGDILNGYDLDKCYDSKIIFKNKDGEEIEILFSDESVHFTRKNEIENYSAILYLPKENEGMPVIRILETNVEKRDNGVIIDYVTKFYDYTTYSTTERNLVDLEVERYVVTDKNLDYEFILNDKLGIKEMSSFSSFFETHMRNVISDGLRKYSNTPYSNVTLENGKDISAIYAIVDGADKLSRIYDLYRGIINKQTADDIYAINLGLLSVWGFDYKRKVGTTKLEDELVGITKVKRSDEEILVAQDLFRNRIGYRLPVDLNDRALLTKIITYEPTAIDISKSTIERMLGISYEEFDALDFDEQQELIRLNKKGKTKDASSLPVMIGSGEHSCFVETGLTPEESRQRLDKKFDELFGKSGIKEGFAKIKSKVDDFFDK